MVDFIQTQHNFQDKRFNDGYHAWNPLTSIMWDGGKWKTYNGEYSHPLKVEVYSNYGFYMKFYPIMFV